LATSDEAVSHLHTLLRTAAYFGANPTRQKVLTEHFRAVRSSARLAVLVSVLVSADLSLKRNHQWNKHLRLEPVVGFEPTTVRLQIRPLTVL
jgi:hypothetical protein